MREKERGERDLPPPVDFDWSTSDCIKDCTNLDTSKEEDWKVESEMEEEEEPSWGIRWIDGEVEVEEGKGGLSPIPDLMGVPEQVVEVREPERDEIELISFESQFELLGNQS